MTAAVRGGAGGSSPLGLRWVHAAIFLGLAAVALVAALPEWRHVLDALGRPYHAGEPPRPVLLVGSLLAAVGTVPLLVGLLRGRSAPLWASGCVLAGVMAAVISGSQGARVERSDDAANLAILSTARRVHLDMVGVLQERSEVPVSPGPWQDALERARRTASEIRDRRFRVVPPKVVWLLAPDSRPVPPVPGDLWVYVSPDGVAFEVRAVGFDAKQPALLRDDTGAPLVLRGLFNPDLPPAEAPGPG